MPLYRAVTIVGMVSFIAIESTVMQPVTTTVKVFVALSPLYASVTVRVSVKVPMPVAVIPI